MLWYQISKGKHVQANTQWITLYAKANVIITEWGVQEMAKAQRLSDPSEEILVQFKTQAFSDNENEL